VVGARAVEVSLRGDPGKMAPRRFWQSPKVWLTGAGVKELRGKFPRGFLLRVVNESAAVLCRHRSPPPEDLDGDGGGAERLPAFAMMDDCAPLDAAFAAGNMSHGEYLARLAPRIDQLRQRIEFDGAPACAIELGVRLLQGGGVRKDPVEGAKFLLLAAAAGDCRAQLLVRPRPPRARARPPAARGAREPRAPGGQVGNIYDGGQGVPPDAAKAVTWWKLAAKGNAMFPDGHRPLARPPARPRA